GVTGNPRQNRGGEGWGLHLAAAHDKEILAWAFSHIAVGVKQQCLIIAQVPHLLAGENRVEVGAYGFGFGHEGINVETLERGSLHPDTFLQTLFTEIRTPGPGGDRDTDGT